MTLANDASETPTDAGAAAGAARRTQPWDDDVIHVSQDPVQFLQTEAYARGYAAGVAAGAAAENAACADIAVQFATTDTTGQYLRLLDLATAIRSRARAALGRAET